jgi:hypothetical protein
MVLVKFHKISDNDLGTIKKLVLNGESLNNISKLTGFNKSTIYYHSKKFKQKVDRNVYLERITLEQLGELIGAFAGDGSYYHQIYNPLKKNSTHHKIRYHLSLKSDRDYANHLYKIIKTINLNPFLITNKNYGRLDISFNSKYFINILKEYLVWDKNKTLSIRLKNEIQNYSLEFLKGFSRGLMDTDGYVEISNVSCACISERLIKNLTQIFDLLSIRYKWSEKRNQNKQTLFLVRVYRDSLESYLMNIGFSNPYKLTSSRNILKK